MRLLIEEVVKLLGTVTIFPLSFLMPPFGKVPYEGTFEPSLRQELVVYRNW